MEYTRVVVQGATRRANLVVPSAEPIAEMLPRLIELLDDWPDGEGTIGLTTILGEPVDNDSSLADQEIRDGAVLLLTRADTAPPPPEVSDVTEAIVAQRGSRLDLWNRRWSEITGAAALAILGAMGAAGAMRSSWRFSVMGVVILVVLAMVLLRWLRRWPAGGVAALAIGSATAVAASLSRALPQGHSHGPSLMLLSAWAFGWLAVLVTLGIAGRRRHLLIAGGAGFAAGALPIAVITASVPETRAAAAAGIVLLCAFGLVPGMAMSLSGLSRIDDDSVAGKAVPSERVDDGVSHAYATLMWLVIALTGPIAWSGAVLGRAGSRSAVALALCIVVITACRARFFPLAEPILCVVVIVSVTVAAMLLRPTNPWWLAPIILFLAVIAVMAVVGWRPAAHVTARARVMSSTAELIATVASVPLALAVFGIFSDLVKVWHV